MNLFQIKEVCHQLAAAWENYTANPWASLASLVSFTEIKEKLYVLCYYVSLV